MRAADWSGGVGETWAQEWQRTDRSFAGLEPALERAILTAADGLRAGGPASERRRMVDIGCGAGTTSLAIAAARPEDEVIGLDLSPDLVAVATSRAESIDGVRERCRFVAGDAVTETAVLAPVDLFFSRHGVMFFDDPIAAFARLRAAAAPAARLVFSCFAAIAENRWASETLADVMGSPSHSASSGIPEPGPFAFASVERVDALLAEAGWRPRRPPEHVTFRYAAGSGEDAVGDALAFFRRIGPAAAALRAAPEEERPALLDRLAAVCRRHRRGDEVAFPAAAWLWSAELREPAA